MVFLTAAQQRRAERILDEINEMEWDVIVAQPHVQKRLVELADEAMHDEGEEGGFDGKEQVSGE
jgi:hypothetical protein